MQNNRKHLNRPIAKPAVAETKKQEGCKCDSSCKCGCQEGKACACGQSGVSASCAMTLIGSILVLFGSLFIAGSILVLSDRIDSIASGEQPQVATTTKGAAVRVDDKAFTDYIKRNPKLIIDTLNEYYQKQQAAQEPAPKVADKALIDGILKDKTNHVLGNPKGSFVVIEFFDYNCGYCKMMNKKMAEAIKKSNNIRWVLMDAPIFGPRSEVIARYAFAAAKQGKFAEFHAALGDTDKKDEEGLKEIGKKLGLNVEKLAKDADSDAAKNKLAENRKYIEKLKINGVPVFVVNGDVRVGAFSDEQMEEYIKQANAKK